MSKGSGLAVGIAIGVAIGVAMNNIGVGIAIGIALGLAYGGISCRKPPNEDAERRQAALSVSSPFPPPRMQSPEPRPPGARAEASP